MPRQPAGLVSAQTPRTARRADPERIFEARRTAVRNGLTDYGMGVEDAERWCDA